MRPGDDVVGQPAQPVHLDLDHVAGLDRPGVRGRSRQQHVARAEGDGAGDVGDQVVHVPLHLVGGAVLREPAVDIGAQPLAVEVPAGDESRAERGHRVRALDAQHRPGIGVAEVMQPEVVGDRVAGDKVAGLCRRDTAAGTPDHDRDFALVVEVAAVGRADHGAAVPHQRRDRLVEVRRRSRQRRAKLGDPAVMVQMHRDDLGRHDRRQVHGVRRGDPPAISGEEVVAFAAHLHDGSVEQDPPVLRHGRLPTGLPWQTSQRLAGRTTGASVRCRSSSHTR